MPVDVIDDSDVARPVGIAPEIDSDAAVHPMDITPEIDSDVTVSLVDNAPRSFSMSRSVLWTSP